MQFGKRATNFDIATAESCPTGRRTAETPKLPALFPKCMHCRPNWPVKGVDRRPLVLDSFVSSPSLHPTTLSFPTDLIGELAAILVALVWFEVAVVLLAAVEAPVGVVEREGLGLAARCRVADERRVAVGVQNQLSTSALLSTVVRRS